MHSNVPRILLPLILVTLVSSITTAQSETEPLAGVIAEDFRLTVPEMPMPADERVESKKSVVLAGALSAVLPGAGQIYAEAPLWRTLLYAGLETAGWTAYAVTSSRGAALTDEFEAYADRHWSVVRYIDWVASNYGGWSDSAVNKPVVADALSKIYTSDDPTVAEWDRVSFVELNRIERAVRGGGFSHTLPEHGAQQYYEQIGKYVQYRAGWDDHARDGDTVIYDPSRVTVRNLEYMERRADANDYLGYASTALGGIVLNHLASLLDAVLAARGYNASVRTELKGSLLPDQRLPPHASLCLTIHF